MRASLPFGEGNLMEIIGLYCKSLGYQGWSSLLSLSLFLFFSLFFPLFSSFFFAYYFYRFLLNFYV